MKSKNDHAYKIAYLKCTLNLNSNSKNEAFSLKLIEAENTNAKLELVSKSTIWKC